MLMLILMLVIRFPPEIDAHLQKHRIFMRSPNRSVFSPWFCQAMYVAIAVAVGRDVFGEPLAVDSSLLPATLEVDSVGVYRFADMDGTAVQVSKQTLPMICGEPGCQKDWGRAVKTFLPVGN